MGPGTARHIRGLGVTRPNGKIDVAKRVLCETAHRVLILGNFRVAKVSREMDPKRDSQRPRP